MRLNKTLLVFIIGAAVLSGCSSTDKKEGSLLEGAKSSTDGASTSQYADGSSLSGQPLDSMKSGMEKLGPEFSDPQNPLSKRTIYFMYDSSQIQQDFISVIAAHAQYLLANPQQQVILEGHADERGSAEYNIALSEQRGKSVYRLMKLHGVSDTQLEIVSYGEEKPSAEGMNEASWQQNRRVEIAYQVR